MIRTFHEAPKCIFKDVQRVTDGDYALVNLFPEDEEYYQLFVDALKAGREVILDNGVFELGNAWNADEFAGWVEKLKPTYYIVPDVLEDCDATIESFDKFMREHKRLPGKVMGVAQGNSYEDFVRCYKALEPQCDKICIGFDLSWYQNARVASKEPPTTFLKAAAGRQQTLLRMVDGGIINKAKPHHLLGVMLPQEVRAYAALQAEGQLRWIQSIDTSNPVVHGLKGICYTKNGLQSKESQKLYTMINAEVTPKQKADVLYNIKMFRRFCNEA